VVKHKSADMYVGWPNQSNDKSYSQSQALYCFRIFVL